MEKKCRISIFVLLTCVLLCACGGTQPEPGEAAPEETVEEPVDNGSIVSSDDGSSGQAEQDAKEAQSAEEPELKVEDLVGEQFSFSGTRGSEEELGYTVDVNYTVPKLLSDGGAAKAINDDIRTFCQDVIEPTEDELAFPTWYEVNYEAFLNGDILSIVITKLCTMDDASGYAVFNYNVKEASVTDNPTLLKSLGYTEDSFVEQMRKAVAYEADENMQYLFEAQYWNSDDTDGIERQSMYADYMRYRQNSIATDRVNVQMPMYLDESGALKVFAEIDVPAGAGSYTKTMEPRKESKAKDFEISFEDSLFLTYQDGIMKIRMERGDWTEATFGGAGSYLEFGREYTVDGIYKDYVDGGMQFVYDGEYAVPVFVSDDGMVSALNLYYCAPAGYFCLTEPVMGLKGIEAITEVNGSEIAAGVGETLIGQFSGFAKKALGSYGQEWFQKTYSIWSEERGLDTYGYFIGFDDQDEGKLLYQVNEAGSENYLCYSGECILIGMNGEGIIIGSRVYADFPDPFDPDPHYSIFSLKRCSKWNDLLGDLEMWADFRGLGGFITFDSVEGELMTLDITYG